MRIEFGAYAQVFDDHTPTNTPAARSIGAIALDPTGNVQGAYNFISLATGARISRHRWTELPIPDTAIARVEALAIRDKMPLLQEHGLVVEWRPDHAIDDDEYDFNYEPPKRPPADNDALSLADFDAVDDSELDDLAQPHLNAPHPFQFADQGALPDDEVVDSDDEEYGDEHHHDDFEDRTEYDEDGAEYDDEYGDAPNGNVDNDEHADAPNGDIDNDDQGAPEIENDL